MAMTREEHARSQRRRARQVLGLVVTMLALLGLFTILRAGAGLVARFLDDSEERAAYERLLSGMVMFDPIAFSGGIENCGDIYLRETAVWGTVYSILDTETGLDNYQRDPETDEALLPAVEVDAYLAKLVGPEFHLVHQTFSMDGMEVLYDELTQCYHIPIVGNMGTFEGKVVKLQKKSGTLRVTVGYIPLAVSSEMVTTSADITKYMDYIFTRSNGNWYLTGLEESEMKPESTPVPAPTAVLPFIEDDGTVQDAIIAGVTGEEGGPEATPDGEDGEEGDGEEGEGEEDGEEEGEDEEGDEAA